MEASNTVACACGLAYVGEVTQLCPIERADRLERAEVDCRDGGRWWGVVSKADGWRVGALARVFLPDALLPETDEFAFMAKYHHRVRVQKLRGVPSEVLIMPWGASASVCEGPGLDITGREQVRKFEKPQAPVGSARVRTFPVFIPRTDEPNFQKARPLVWAMRGKRVYITQKLDGCSMTIYRRGEHVGVCSRNQEIERDESVWWNVAVETGLIHDLPDGYAVQGELVGPGIQGNPLGLSAPAFRPFQVYNIDARVYLNMLDFLAFCGAHGLSAVPCVPKDTFESDDELRALAEQQVYPNGAPAEGIVVRPQHETVVNGERCSVKVLSLVYKG